MLLPGIGGVHLFDWDEINFAESAREMLVTGNLLDVQVNFETFWEKPPLFIWMQALSMKIFGVNEFAARFPNAICGTLTLLILFFIGRHLKDDRFGLTWVLVYAGSILPFFYFKSGLIDPWFNLFIFSGIYSFIRFSEERGGRQWAWIALSAVSLGLATLTKGPVGFLIFGLTFIMFVAFYFHRWKKAEWSIWHVLAFLAIFAVVGGLWFILQICNGHLSIIQDFIAYQIRLFETKDAGHGGFLLYHFVWLFFGVMPATALALPTFTLHTPVCGNERMDYMMRWMRVLFWVVLILFTIVNTKIVHYSSMCYFPLTFFAAYQINRVSSEDKGWSAWVRWTLLVVSIIFGGLIIALTQFDNWKEAIIPYINDPFAVANIRATADWRGYEAVTGVILLFGAIWFFAKGSNKGWQAASGLLICSTLFTLFTMTLVVPQVEKYTQAAAIEFFESKKGEDCYILTYRYKSYAHYFYSDRKPGNRCDDSAWLTTGAIDKPCYIVVKEMNDDVEVFLNNCPDATHLYSKNGFQFYKREIKND